MLNDFNGDKSKLGMGEKFLIALTSISHYQLRLEGMIAKEDFKSTIDMLNEKISVLLNATEGNIDKILKCFIFHRIMGKLSFLQLAQSVLVFNLYSIRCSGK